MLRSTTLAAAIAAATVFAAPAARATESFDACTGVITSLPATITKAGVWCLQKDLSTSMSSGTAITVAANNVTVNCNGFRLGGLGGGAMAMTMGISSNALNTRVQNCHTRGFGWAVSFTGAGGVVEDSIIEAASVTGIHFQGDGHEARRNRLIDIGGTDFQPMAIHAGGAVSIHDNLISGVWSPTASAFGVQVSTGSNATLHDNTFMGLSAEGIAGVYAIAIFNATAVVERNRFHSGHAGIGVQCTDSSTVVRGNAFVGFGEPLGGCADDGGNVSVGLAPPPP